MNIYVYTYTSYTYVYTHGTTTNQKIGHEFERKQGGVYDRLGGRK